MTEIDIILVSKEELEMRKHMTTRYTSLWKLSDFLLDVAAEINDPIIAGKVHSLHAEVAPSDSRDIIETVDAEKIVTQVVDMWKAAQNN